MSATSFSAPRLDDTAQRLLWKIANYLGTGLGSAGSQRVSGTGEVTGSFVSFHAFTDSVITSITYSVPGGAAAGDTIKAGDSIYGSITGLALSSGTGELYNTP